MYRSRSIFNSVDMFLFYKLNRIVDTDTVEIGFKICTYTVRSMIYIEVKAV